MTSATADIQRLYRLAAEKANRDLDALSLYEPLPFQDMFHRCRTKECVLQKGNRAGGSIAGFAEDARAVLNRDPYKKYRNRQGQKVLLLLGFGVTHVGTVIYPKLFLEGAFNIIRDERTKQWRVFKPWQEYDEAYKEKARPAPPLIPPRMVIPKTWNWDAKSAGIFKSVELKTGWKIWCFPSSGDPRQAQGFNVDLAHIDEDIEQPGWYTEIIARLGEVHGFLRWTAMPHMANEVLLKIIQRGREQEGEPEDKRTTTIVRASVEDNPYFPKDELERNKRIWRDEGEDVYRMRMHGELTYDSVLCYPSFREEVHTISLHDLPDGRVPSNWCRYMVVDPGHAKMGVLYAAIDPEEKFVTIYDEIRPVQCDAEFLASTVAQRNRGQHFHAFIIDDHGSRRTNAGTGTTDREEYVKAFKKYGIRSHITGHDFIPGSDDVMGRQNVVRQWLRPRENGLPPRLRIVRECCPQLIKEFKKFRKKQQYGVTIDDPQYRGETDVIVCLEYLAAFGPTYVAPKPPNATYEAYERFLAERRRKARGVLGGAAVYF